jgi:hypothetical protein
MDMDSDSDIDTDNIVVTAINRDGESVDVTLQERGEYAYMDFTGANFTDAYLGNADFYRAILTDVIWPEWWLDVMDPRGVDLSINQFHDLNDTNPVPQDILARYGNNNFSEFVQRYAWDSNRNLNRTGGKRMRRKSKHFKKGKKKYSKKRKGGKKRRVTKRKY